jgi:3,4-dihydroxy 2-butanone 4-phosphate synthase/GTP cyclohydrolase II
MIVYVNRVAYAEHIALIKGDIEADGPIPVRVHALNVLEDVLGDDASGKAHELSRAMEMIGEEGRGIVVLIREPRATSLSDRVSASLVEGEHRGGALRDYGVGAQILRDLGVRDMILLSNTERTIIGLQGYGLNVVERRSIPPQEK